MKLINIIALFMAVIITLVSCGGKKTVVANPDSVPFEIVSSTLAEHTDLITAQGLFYSEAEDEMDRLDEFYATQFLGNGSDFIDLELLSAYCVMSVSAASASEIGVLKLKNETDTETAVSWVEAHFKRIESNFSSYIEAEADIARGSEVRVSGCFVYYAASSDNAALFDSMEAALTK